MSYFVVGQGSAPSKFTRNYLVSLLGCDSQRQPHGPTCAPQLLAQHSQAGAHASEAAHQLPLALAQGQHLYIVAAARLTHLPHQQLHLTPLLGRRPALLLQRPKQQFKAATAALLSDELLFVFVLTGTYSIKLLGATHLWQHEAGVALELEVTDACYCLRHSRDVFRCIVRVVRPAGVEGGPLRCPLLLGLAPGVSP